MEKQKKIYAYWLCCIPTVGNRTRDKLLQVFGTPEQVYCASEGEWAKIVKPLQVKEMKKWKEQWEPAAEYEKIEAQGIRFVSRDEAVYPKRLRNIPDAPMGIFIKGELPKEGGISVAVIGARDCSEYGKYIAYELGKCLGVNGICVVSGMARGIDSISQEAALKAGGTSIAVLGNGVDICYPAQSRYLYQQLQQQGCLLSTYPPGTAPRPQNFPPRNRIVSGLADVLVVVEARNKSGTLITVDMALEQGKEVYVVPGRITDRLSDGCNRLMKQGASIFLSPDEFMEEIRVLVEQQQGQRNHILGKAKSVLIEEMQGKTVGNSKGAKEKGEGMNSGNEGERNMNGKEAEKGEEMFSTMSKELRMVYEVLDMYPQSTEQILSKLSGAYSVQWVNTILMRLCLENWALQVSPGYFARNHRTVINSENVLKK